MLETLRAHWVWLKVTAVLAAMNVGFWWKSADKEEDFNEYDDVE